MLQVKIKFRLKFFNVCLLVLNIQELGLGDKEN